MYHHKEPLYDEPGDEFPPPPGRFRGDGDNDDEDDAEEDPYEVFGKKAEMDIEIDGFVDYSYEIGSKGRGPAQFGGWIQNFAISDDGYTLYACDVFNKRIQIVSLPDRKCKHSFTTTMPQYEFQARGIAVLRGGNLCVNCVGYDGTSRIGIFTPEGQLVNSFGPGLIGASSAMTVDFMDRITIIDRRKMKIIMASKNGKGIAAFDNPVKTDSLRICAKGNGDLVIPDHLKNVVWLLDEKGVTKAKITPPGGPRAAFVYPAGVAVDCNDNIFICDVGNHCVHRFGPDGDSNKRILTKADNSLWRPHDIVISKRGHLLLSEVGKTYIKLMGFRRQ